jgi:hypothetical protein
MLHPVSLFMLVYASAIYAAIDALGISISVIGPRDFAPFPASFLKGRRAGRKTELIQPEKQEDAQHFSRHLLRCLGGGNLKVLKM